MNHNVIGFVIFLVVLLLMAFLNYIFAVECSIPLWGGFLLGIILVYAHYYRVTGKLKM